MNMTKNKPTKSEPKDTDVEIKPIPSMSSVEWTDYVLGLLTDDEKISGNPTTDGLRRIFETVLDCTIIANKSQVVQSPTPENEKRATVVCTLDFVLNDQQVDPSIKNRTITGAADVYWGNCDKIYRNHPVAVAETRAEGRALRRALRLRKVVAAEEIAENIEDNPSEDTVSKISINQMNFIDVIAKRINVNILNFVKTINVNHEDIKNVSHTEAVSIIKKLTEYQQNISEIPENVVGYDPQWKDKI